MLIGKLNCGVSVFTQRGQVKKTLTTVYVRMGQEVIAERTIPGKWNEHQALVEFKRFPKRFTLRAEYKDWDLEKLAA